MNNDQNEEEDEEKLMLIANEEVSDISRSLAKTKDMEKTTSTTRR